MDQDEQAQKRSNWSQSEWQQEHPQYHPHAAKANDEKQDEPVESDEEVQSIYNGAHSSRPKRKLSPTQRRPFRRRSTLESEQSGDQESQRREVEGDEGDLTELAIPAPNDRNHIRRDSFEVEERRARMDRESGASTDDNAFLTEVAAPDPVEDDDRAPRDEDKEDASSELRSPHSEKKSEAETTPLSATATHLYTISYLILFSILGTLARLGLEAINYYPQAPFTSVVIWANIGGSLFMGFLAEDRRLFREEWGTESKNWSFNMSGSNVEEEQAVQKAHAKHGKVKKTIPLFIGLATGFCGSLTSFSSFIRDAFLALTNDLASPSPTSPFHTISDPGSRNGGYSFEATVAVLIIQVACSISALHFGAHLALFTDPFMPTLPL